MNKYGPKARAEIAKAMHLFSQGKLLSGKEGKRVRTRDQAIAIGISRAKNKGYKVPKGKEQV